MLCRAVPNVRAVHAVGNLQPGHVAHVVATLPLQPRLLAEALPRSRPSSCWTPSQLHNTVPLSSNPYNLCTSLNPHGEKCPSRLLARLLRAPAIYLTDRLRIMERKDKTASTCRITFHRDTHPQGVSRLRLSRRCICRRDCYLDCWHDTLRTRLGGLEPQSER